MKEYPLYYYHRRQIKESDKDFVLARMAAIPKEHKDKVSNRYERIFRDNKGNNRKRANTFLHKVAKSFRNKER